jgi:hypothetical protein
MGRALPLALATSSGCCRITTSTACAIGLIQRQMQALCGRWQVAQNWRKHCRKYNACGRPVYFVQDNWYNDVYVPRYRETHRGDQGERHGNKDHGKHRNKDWNQY